MTSPGSRRHSTKPLLSHRLAFCGSSSTSRAGPFHSRRSPHQNHRINSPRRPRSVNPPPFPTSCPPAAHPSRSHPVLPKALSPSPTRSWPPHHLPPNTCIHQTEMIRRHWRPTPCPRRSRPGSSTSRGGRTSRSCWRPRLRPQILVTTARWEPVRPLIFCTPRSWWTDRLGQADRKSVV